MRGLKLGITFTLLLLLAIGMLLTDALTTALKQRSLITTTAGNYTAMLTAAATSCNRDVHVLEGYLRAFGTETPGFTGAVFLDGSWGTAPIVPCGGATALHTIAARASQKGKTVTTNPGGMQSLFLSRDTCLQMAVPLPKDRFPSGAVAAAVTLPSVRHSFLRDQKIILVYILVNTMILTVIGFFRLASLVIRPIERLITKTSSYQGEQDLGFISESEGSEFRQLSAAINGMVKRIDRDKISLQQTVHSLQQANETISKTQGDMMRAEKLASVGRLSAGLAHEIGNPLGIILGYLGLLRQENLTEEEKRDYIGRTEQELNRISMLVRQLLDFARPLPSTREPVKVHALLLDLQQMLRTRRKNLAVSFVNRLQAEPETVRANKEALRQAFLNFYLNALDAIQESNNAREGAIVTESEIIRDAQENAIFRLTITDNGIGIARDHLTNIFDPFYTTKEPGKGTGLGLSVSHTIIENAGGRIKVESTEGQGTSIIIKLPAAGDHDG